MATQTANKSDRSYDSVGDGDEEGKKKGFFQRKLDGTVNCFRYCRKSAHHKRESDGKSLFCWLTCFNWFEYTVFLTTLWIVAGLFFYAMLAILMWEPTDSLWAFLIVFGAFVLLFGALIATYKAPMEEGGEHMACSVGKLQRHIERHQDFKGMKWEELGSTWYIAHALPLRDDNQVSSGYEDTLEQICKRLHWTNIKPVMSKGVQKSKAEEKESPRVEQKGNYEEKETVVTMHN